MPDSSKVILVIGAGGAGKTTYAASLDVPVLSFDAVHDYGSGATDYDWARRWAEEHRDYPVIAVDAWDYVNDREFKRFRQIFADRTSEIHFLYTTHMLRYLAQRNHIAAGHFPEFPVGQDSLVGNTEVWVPWMLDLAKLVDPLFAPVHWLFRGESGDVEPRDYAHFRLVTDADPVWELLDWIDSKSFDPSYQTIELDGKVVRQGYATSEESWGRIAAWLDWRGKSVADMGCFHGYFCLKVEEAGAQSVVGYDRSEGALTVATRLAGLRGSQCVFALTEFSSPAFLKRFDTILVMNVLHHIGRREDDFLRSVFGAARQSVILEINRKERSLVEQAAVGFKIVRETDSHRVTNNGRRVLLCYERIDQ